METFKPGDTIVLSQEYIIFQRNGLAFLRNTTTGDTASAIIECKDINAITEDEMKRTHGIKQFHITAHTVSDPKLLPEAQKQLE